MKWFRLYDEILDDPKMMELTAKEFQTWILLLCLANKETFGERGEIPRDFSVISRQIHGEKRVISQILKRFIEMGLLQENGQSIKIVNWDKRQYKSDDSYLRVKRYRNVTVTASDTDTEYRVQSTESLVQSNNTENNTKYKQKHIAPMLGEFTNVKLSWGSLKKLENQLGKENVKEIIEEMSRYMASTGKVYADHYATIYSWAVRKGLVKRGNKTDGGVNDNVFLRTIQQEDERATAKRLAKRSEEVS